MDREIRRDKENGEDEEMESVTERKRKRSIKETVK